MNAAAYAAFNLTVIIVNMLLVAEHLQQKLRLYVELQFHKNIIPTSSSLRFSVFACYGVVFSVSISQPECTEITCIYVVNLIG